MLRKDKKMDYCNNLSTNLSKEKLLTCRPNFQNTDAITSNNIMLKKNPKIERKGSNVGTAFNESLNLIECLIWTTEQII